MAGALEDRQQIEDLLAKYAYILDVGGTEDEFLSIFTDDAVLESPLIGSYPGKAALREFYRTNLGYQQDHIPRHYFTNFIVTVDGDRATLQCYFLGTSTYRKPRLPLQHRSTELVWAGTYDCTARRIDGSWRLERRTLHLDQADKRVQAIAQVSPEL